MLTIWLILTVIRSENMKKITWLHLSDMHIDADNDNDNYEVRQAFIEYLSDKLPEQNIKIDFIVVTGDIANKGRKKDYNLAHEFLNQVLTSLDLDWDHIFCVAGNHDIDISKLTPLSGSYLYEIANKNDNNRLNEIVSNNDIMGFCAPKLEQFVYEYNSLYNYYNRILGSYYKKILVAGHNIGITALNTAWLSQGKGDIENGHMAVGENQVRPLLRMSKKDDNALNICIYHHPINSWMECDKTRDLLRNRYDFLLCGHLHRPNNSYDIANDSIELQCGSLYASREYPNGFSIYEYYPERTENNVRIILRKYSDSDGGFFTNDDTTYKNAANGELLFTLKKRVPNSSNKNSTLYKIYSDIGNRKTAFPKDMSFQEIFNNSLYIPASFTDSVGQYWEFDKVVQHLKNHNALFLGEPGSGKSFFSYCTIRQLLQEKIYTYPIDLKQLYDNEIKPSYNSIVHFLFGDIGVSNPLFLIDSVDEFCGTKERNDFCEKIVNCLKSHGTLCVLCRRYEYDLFISDIIDADIFSKIYSLNNWHAKIEFLQYLKIISPKEGLNENQIYKTVCSNELLCKLVQRPLHARMLIYVIKSSNQSTLDIYNIADLYEQYFSKLSKTVKGFSAKEILKLWRESSWLLYKSGYRSDRKIYIREIEEVSSSEQRITRAVSPLVNWTEDISRSSYTYIHYSFYEFLVAYHFSLNLEAALLSNNYSECQKLFAIDFTQEIRHYATMLLKKNKSYRTWNKLINLYEYPDDNENLALRRVHNNLLFYFIGRLSNLTENDLNMIINQEPDIFSKTSAYWAMCNLNYEKGLLDYLHKLSNVEYASFNRGYLLYYYGDLDRTLPPPYKDSYKDTPWGKTRAKNMKMFSESLYSEIPVTRKLIDVYTFADFAFFHKTELTQYELTCLNTIVSSITSENNYIKDAIAIVNNKILEVSYL